VAQQRILAIVVAAQRYTGLTLQINGITTVTLPSRDGRTYSVTLLRAA